MYQASRDFIVVDGLELGGVLDGEEAFTYTDDNDAVITRVDSGGKRVDFENTNKMGSGTIKITPNERGVTANKKLRTLFNTKKLFNITRDNRNEGGEKVDLFNCRIVNDGGGSKNSSGEKGAREWKYTYESKQVQEGAY